VNARASDSMFYPLTLCALQIVFLIMIIMIMNHYSWCSVVLLNAMVQFRSRSLQAPNFGLSLGYRLVIIFCVLGSDRFGSIQIWTFVSSSSVTAETLNT